MYLAAAAASAEAATSYTSNGAATKQRVLQRLWVQLLTGLTGTSTKAATKGAATVAKTGSRIVCPQ